jgi:hypothetical protein
MTLHDSAVGWVAEKVGGTTTHRRVSETKVYGIGRFEPDVIVRRSPTGRVYAIHEVEVLDLEEGKVAEYASTKMNRVLWIVLPKGASGIFNIHLIEPTLEGEFKEVRLVSVRKNEQETWTGRRL